MSELIERIAQRAWQSMDEISLVQCEAIVRLTIESIREPTQAMIDAGNQNTDWGAGAEDAWRAMIDEMLEERPSTIGKGLDDEVRK